MEDMHIHLKAGVTDITIMKNYIQRCKEVNIDKVLFLDHGNRISAKHTPVLNDTTVIKKFLENINKIKSEYKNMEIYSGIECDFSYDKEFQEREIELINQSGFDLVIGSVHGMAKAEYKDYLKANLDMLNIYPIDILGHLKLRKEYEDYKELIEEIVRTASQKGIKLEINTSERSRWNLKQLQYMLDLFKVYGTEYTIGSDAHCIEEIGFHISETYVKLDKILNNAERLEKKVYSLLYLNRVDYLVSQNTGESQTNMKEVVEDVMQDLKLIRSDVKIKYDLHDSYFRGSYEPWRITIENIVDNALRYAQDKVKITVRENEITVFNNGSQISEERLESLFKPFEKIIIMEYDLVGIGTIKMTVGVRRRTREKVQYCITAITNQL